MATADQIAAILAKLQQLETEQATLKDLFLRATASVPASGSSGGTAKLNFREAERQMPKEFSGKSIAFAEYCFKIEAYMATLDPAGKGDEIIRGVAAQ